VETGGLALTAIPTEFRLDGKTAVITGGGSGIGRAVALRFAAAGADVRILEIDETSASTVADEIAASGGSASFHSCDVTDQGAVSELLNRIAGRGRIHILVNNAGISHVGNVETTTEEDFDRVMRVNVKGYYNCTRAALGRMKENGGGVILNMASVAGSAGLADRFAYSTSKGAVIAMTLSVARDYIAHGIRCNCLSPARVHTPFVDDYLHRNYPGREQEMYGKLAATQPIGRMGEPEEVASLALFLCSDAAAFITGTNYTLDGGFMNLHG
jgi:2-keto-3-deoxy-L-fuconate dehydrogenase